MVYWLFVGENEPGQWFQFLAHAKHRDDALVMLYLQHGILCLHTDREVHVNVKEEYPVGYFKIKPRPHAVFVDEYEITNCLDTFKFKPVNMKILRTYKMNRVLNLL